MKTRLTEEQKKAICEEYKDRRNKVNDICEKFGLARYQVARIAVEMGAEPRQTKTKRGVNKRVCPKCKKSIDVKGAKFCCFCGSDIRSNKELLIERVENAFSDIVFMPVNARDNMQKLFLDIINELKG